LTILATLRSVSAWTGSARPSARAGTAAIADVGGCETCLKRLNGTQPVTAPFLIGFAAMDPQRRSSGRLSRGGSQDNTGGDDVAVVGKASADRAFRSC